MIWHHRFALLVAFCTLLLVTAGAMVTSTGSGLSVPDWPTTYGESMFTFPVSRWVGGILYEHGHRLIASTVGLLTILLAAWTARVDRRAWVKALAFFALAAVVTQGILGGMTVLFLLPAPISVGHAGLAEIFFATTVTLALVTSPAWRRGYGQEVAATPARGYRRFALATTILVYGQILIGATVRHTGAGLAIPDFPLAFGQLVPVSHLANPLVAVQFAHRVIGLAAALAIFALAWRTWKDERGAAHLLRPALLASCLVIVQIALGGCTVLSGRNVAVNTAHVATGASIFATLVVLTLRAYRRLIDGGGDGAGGATR